MSSWGRRTSSWRLEGRASGSSASSSSIGGGENGPFSPKWAAGTDDDIGVRRVRLSCVNRDGGGCFCCSNPMKGDDED